MTTILRIFSAWTHPLIREDWPVLPLILGIGVLFVLALNIGA